MYMHVCIRITSELEVLIGHFVSPRLGLASSQIIIFYVLAKGDLICHKFWENGQKMTNNQQLFLGLMYVHACACMCMHVHACLQVFHSHRNSYHHHMCYMHFH